MNVNANQTDDQQKEASPPSFGRRRLTCGRMCLWLFCLVALAWFTVGLLGKWRYTHYLELSRRAILTKAAVAVEQRVSDTRFPRPMTTVMILGLHGAYRSTVRGQDALVTVIDGRKGVMYSPLWKIASRWTVSEQEQKPSEFFLNQLLLPRRYYWRWRFWMNPLCSANTRQDGQSSVLTVSYRSLAPREETRHSVWVAHGSYLPERAVMRAVVAGGEKFGSEISVLHYHDTLPKEQFHLSLPSDASVLNDHVRHALSASDMRGDRLLLFWCSMARKGQILLGFYSESIGKQHLLIDRVLLLDGRTSDDMTPGYDRHYGSWQCGHGGEVDLWCFTPKLPSLRGPTKLNIEVAGGIFREYTTRSGKGSRRVEDVNFRYAGIRPRQVAASTFPPLVRPTWNPRMQ